MFIDPLSYGGQWEHVRLAVAIVEADGHKSINTAEQVLRELLEKAGVDPAMILSAGSSALPVSLSVISLLVTDLDWS